MGWNTYYRFVLLVEGRRRRRAEDGAAVRGGPEMRPVNSPDEAGKPVSSMRRPRPGLVSRTREAPSQPSAGITTGCPRAGLHVWTMKERWPPLRIRAVMACRRPEARPQGDRKRRKWSAGRRLPPIARRKETPRKRLGRLRQPLRERSQAPASAGAPLPSRSEELHF